MFGRSGHKLRIEGELLDTVCANVWQLRAMSAADRDAVLEAAIELLPGLEFEACGGLVLDDEMRATIAAQVALLCHRLPADTRPDKLPILVYPDVFFRQHETHSSVRIGEVGTFGTVVLSWHHVLLCGLSRDTVHVVSHEVAHVLDGASGAYDGVPLLADPSRLAAWKKMLEDELDEHRLETARQRDPLISVYATTNEAEFFAEATTYFVQKGAELREQRPRLYDHLASLYRLDPTTWTLPPGEAPDPRIERLTQDRRQFLIDEYGKSVAEHPQFGVGHLELARLLAEADRLDEALRHFDKAIRLMPGEAELHRERGSWRMEANDLAGAIQDFSRALVLAPRWVQALCDRAQAWLLTGARDKALEDARAALVEDPESDVALGAQGAALLECCEWRAAEQAYGEALALFPDAAGHLFGRAIALYELGAFESALADAEGAIELGAAWPDLLELRDSARAALDEQGPQA